MLTEAVAREALAPIRALHKPSFDGDDVYCAECCDLVDDVIGFDLCYQPWPCATARLIYTAEELSDD